MPYRAPGSPSRGQRSFLKGRPIQYYRPTGDPAIRNLIENGFQAFNAGRLSEACHIFADKMLAPENDTTIGLTIAGALTPAGLDRHPKQGASWEGFVIETLLTALRPDEAYFWATHQGAELDLLLIHHGKRYGVEVKRADAPTLTASMRIAMTDLKLDHLAVIYPGPVGYRLARRAGTVPGHALASMTWKTITA